MCDPGSPECRTRDALAATPEQVGQLAADAIAALGGRPPLPGEHRPPTIIPMPEPVIAPPRPVVDIVRTDLLDQLVADARADLAHAIATARPLATIELITRHWRRTRPGFARLLDLTDQD